MIPLSLGHTSSLNADRAAVRDSLTWLRPANIASVNNADVQSLIRWLALFVALGVVIGLGHVWLRLKVVDLGYRLSATRQVVEKLQLEGHELTVEVAALDTPGRLEAVATQRLGMTRPQKGMEVVVP